MKKEIMQSISSLVAEYNHLEGSHRGTDAQNVLRRIFDTAAALEKERDALKQRLAVEVRLAYQEGHRQGVCRLAETVEQIKLYQAYWQNEYEESRAKRVANGEENV